METQDTVPGSRSGGALLALLTVPVGVGGVVATHALAWYAKFHPALGEPVWSADPPAYALLLAVAAGALGGIGHTVLVDRNRGGWALVLLLGRDGARVRRPALRALGRRAVGRPGDPNPGHRVDARPGGGVVVRARVDARARRDGLSHCARAPRDVVESRVRRLGRRRRAGGRHERRAHRARAPKAEAEAGTRLALRRAGPPTHGCADASRQGRRRRRAQPLEPRRLDGRDGPEGRELRAHGPPPAPEARPARRRARPVRAGGPSRAPRDRGRGGAGRAQPARPHRQREPGRGRRRGHDRRHARRAPEGRGGGLVLGRGGEGAPGGPGALRRALARWSRTVAPARPRALDARARGLRRPARHDGRPPRRDRPADLEPAPPEGRPRAVRRRLVGPEPHALSRLAPDGGRAR